MNSMTQIKISKRTGRISHGIGDVVVLKPESSSAKLSPRPWAWARGFVFAKKQRGPVFDLQGKPAAGSTVDRLIVHVPDRRDPTTNWFYLDEATIPLADVENDPARVLVILSEAREGLDRESTESRQLLQAVAVLAREMKAAGVIPDEREARGGRR